MRLARALLFGNVSSAPVGTAGLRHKGDAMASGEPVPPDDDDSSSPDGIDWTIPADRHGVDDVDPWAAAIDDWSEEVEQPFQYPAGLP